MLSNAYFVAKFRFDTAENEPAKNLQNFANFINFPKGLPDRPGSPAPRDEEPPSTVRRRAGLVLQGRRPGLRDRRRRTYLRWH